MVRNNGPLDLVIKWMDRANLFKERSQPWDYFAAKSFTKSTQNYEERAGLSADALV